MKNLPDSASILLVGSENILALSVIRALGSFMPDAEIHTLSSERENKSISELSKHVTSRHCFSSDNLDNCYHELVSIIEKTGTDILLPIEEKDVRMISLLKHKLKEFVYLPPLPSPYAFDNLIYKNKLGDLLESYNLPRAVIYPLSKGVSTINDDKYPCLLKPVRGSSGIGIKKIINRDSLFQNLNSIDTEKYILQEYIPGEDVGCSFLAVDGELKALTVQKVLNGEKLGVATAMQFIEDDSITDYVNRLLEITGFNGWANLDFRRDSRDGEIKLIDFNARFWFSLLASKAAGVDFTRLICQAATGTEISPPTCRNITYFMGRNSFKYYLKKVTNPNPNKDSFPVYTDLWDRIKDPLPEIARYLK